MNKNPAISTKHTDVITISDLKDYYFENKPITSDQVEALKSFDKYRVEKLRDITDDQRFQKQYFDLQIIENTVDYREFLENLVF